MPEVMAGQLADNGKISVIFWLYIYNNYQCAYNNSDQVAETCDACDRKKDQWALLFYYNEKTSHIWNVLLTRTPDRTA